MYRQATRTLIRQSFPASNKVSVVDGQYRNSDSGMSRNRTSRRLSLVATATYVYFNRGLVNYRIGELEFYFLMPAL